MIQYVPTVKRAWHAGLSNFRGRNACNDFSVGIELEGTGEVPFTAAQYQALGELLPGHLPSASGEVGDRARIYCAWTKK